MKIIQPTYLCTQPSTGKKIEFRPYTNKEEKSLLLALQEDDIYTVAVAIKNVVSVCTDGVIDCKTVPYYDIEYIFMAIRAKSVGEIIDLEGSCSCSDAKTEFSVDIGDIVVEPTPTKNPIVKIVGTPYSVTLKHPNFDSIVKSIDLDSEQASETVANCIVNVFTDEEVMTWSTSETLEFIDSMTSIQQRDIAKFILDMPAVKLPTKYVCRKCKIEHTGVLSGFRNFFL